MFKKHRIHTFLVLFLPWLPVSKEDIVVLIEISVLTIVLFHSNWLEGGVEYRGRKWKNIVQNE